MADVYIEQYRNVARDGAGAVIPVEGALIAGGSTVLSSSGTGATVELDPAAEYIYVRATGDCYGGWTNDPDDLDDTAALENDRFDLPDGFARWKVVQGTHFSVILKVDA